MQKEILNIYTHEFAPKHGGIATYCHEFSKAAALLGYITSVFAPKTSKASTEIYSLKPQKWQGNHSIRSIAQAHRFFKTEYAKSLPAIHLLAEPGSILAYGSLPKTIREPGQTHIVVHGSEVQRWKKNSPARALANRAFASAQSINAVSEHVAGIAKNSFPMHAAKVRAVLNALPSSYLEATPPTKNSELPGITDKIHILGVGRIHPRKGFDHCIRAIGQLPPETRNQIQYTIIGGSKDSRYASQLQALAHSLDVPLLIQLDATTETLDQAYRAADIFALTSVPYKNSVEGFGLVYLEAGYYGLPCIAYDIGGVSQAVLHEHTGRLVPVGDLEALAGSILYFVENQEARETYGSRGQSHALSRTWKDIVQETLQA